MCRCKDHLPYEAHVRSVRLVGEIKTEGQPIFYSIMLTVYIQWGYNPIRYSNEKIEGTENNSVSDQIITTEQNAHIDFDTELETPRLVALLFAEWVSKSADGKPVLAGVFDRIFFRPGTPTVFFVYLKLGQAHKEKSDIFIYGPTGERLAEIGVEPPELGSVPDRNPVYMQVITQVALPFEQEGVYWFEVVYQERRLALATLHVERLKDNNDVTSNT